MGTVQNKRGSGRGAPPNVYIPFCADQSPDAGERMARVGKELAYWMLATLVFSMGILILSKMGLWPIDWIEDRD